MTESTTATVHRAWAADLDPATLYELLRLRVEVFVVEQACPYGELDGRDLEDAARHYWLVGHHGNPAPVLGYVRLLREAEDEFLIGRLCTARTARGHGLGRQLMEAALAEVGDATCLLHVQEHLAGFYQAFGFVISGDSYVWEGVSRVPMRREGR
ncbi:GNAT family N-acetyltransferase [Pseudonocardia sp. TRM90224]|uniref:GNAT family N-acetyltransferase n=1 Tax=Pseudonocardia sp. TRM90224 TaxID=2812678 RepID=UPI001E3FC740|nr:GNAT family N-acetyltransferase [Pseudonocardia sp. TRM90224]